MSNKRLLTTYDVFHPEIIKEQVEGLEKPRIKLKGILQRADTLNQNGRIYPRDILEREIKNYQKFIVERRALGEIDHPDSSTIELKNVSHVVTEANMDADGVVHGVIEILDTPGGMTLQKLIEAGIKLGISSRGIGSTAKKGDYRVVQDDFQLICFDAVSEPSTPEAFLLPEGKKISLDEINKVFNRSDRINRIVNEILGDNK